MKVIITSLLLFCAVVYLNGQAPFPTKDEIKQFTESKTCVVLEEDQMSTFNTYIKEAVKEFWTVTPYEFIEVKEFNVRRQNPAYSFIVLTQTNYEKDKTGGMYNYLNLLQGKKGSRLGDMPEICAIPLSFASEDDLEYGYKLGAILRFIQKHAALISEDPTLTGRRYLKFYNRNIPEVASRTILVREGDLSPALNSIEKIKAIYQGDIRIVPEDEIVKAISSKAPRTLVLHMVGPVGEATGGYCFKMLIGTDDSDMYYYHQHLINKYDPNGLLPADLKRLSK